jgi:hypothetical protein
MEQTSFWEDNTHLVKKYLHFMDSEGSFLYIQEAITSPLQNQMNSVVVDMAYQNYWHYTAGNHKIYCWQS